MREKQLAAEQSYSFNELPLAVRRAASGALVILITLSAANSCIEEDSGYSPDQIPFEQETETFDTVINP